MIEPTELRRIADANGAPEMDPLRRAADTIEAMSAALMPFAAIATEKELSALVADSIFPVNIGIMNGNICQSIIERKLRVEDFRRAATFTTGETEAALKDGRT